MLGNFGLPGDNIDRGKGGTHKGLVKVTFYSAWGFLLNFTVIFVGGLSYFVPECLEAKLRCISSKEGDSGANLVLF